MPQDNETQASSNKIARRLAAILAADVAGYSRLTSIDEEGTAKMLLEHRSVTDALIENFGGRIANTAGDSIIAEFASSVEAVRCAVEIQEAIRTRNLSVPSSSQVQFRIGINVGDVILQDGDLLGDSVNVAARLESLAEPGGICLSGEVHDQIQGKLSLGFRAMGTKRLRNIDRPVRAYNVEGVQDVSVRKENKLRILAAGGAFFAAACLGLVYVLTARDSTTTLSGGSPPWTSESNLDAPPLPQMSDVVASGEWNEHSYYAILTWGSSWQSAVADAKERGGYLASITSEAENSFVFELIKNDERLWDMHQDGQAFGPWIGTYQEEGAIEPDGGWALVSGEPVTFSNWSEGQPNNHGGNSDVVRFHNYVHQPSPYWDDANGTGSSRGYILEVERVDSTN
ncbi:MULTISPECIES: adenylate/guanylate cyclase domain-containing protein [unclassified Ruegeria]|uniref:adenylate/guanylate cyclase domain-containing protein n=1 Tax=unclassified Ruegeria TaxID=2625375 RepID=UPI001AE64E4B|nr:MULTISPECIES: adenylate/guanylate cyclase domain-containing protein [unclassified Ruegeria]